MRDGHIFTEFVMQNIRHRVGIRDYGDRTVRLLPVKQQPGIDAFRFGCRQRTLETKSVCAEERIHGRDDPGIHWSVEIEAARVISGMHPKRIDFGRLANLVKPNGGPALRCRGVMHDRHERFDD